MEENIRQGSISVNTENIFPIIKKSLYSNHEIFLRELVSNAVDATQKIKTLSSLSEFKGELGELKITISLDEENKTITISDNGIGLTADEMEKYINQVAFSGATEFVEKYQGKTELNQMIGQFGLGFYSAFMVAKEVEIHSLSWKEASEPAIWKCDGSTSFTISKGSKTTRGTDIVLHIAEDSEEFLTKFRLNEVLTKYGKFLPVNVEFDGKIINNTNPLWMRKPSDLTDEDYIKFYEELYPFAEKPLFWIHLNVDFPFTLTGILYFPKFKADFEPQKNKIQLYSNQVFITDAVEDIVPEFLRLLHGVIDSPDIPLNVSRSFLQTDSNVKKINSHITKKVADKLNDIFKADRAQYEEKWPFLDLFVKFGMLSDEKFYDKAISFLMLQDTDNKLFTVEEYLKTLEESQKNKDGKTVVIYTSNPVDQHSYISALNKKGYSVLHLGSVIDSHFVGMLENKFENVTLKRVDASPADKIIEKDEEITSVLNEDQTTQIKTLFETLIGDKKHIVKTEALSTDEQPVLIIRSEFMRRYAEMAKTSGNQMFGMPMDDMLEVVINTNHPFMTKIVKAEDQATQINYAEQAYDLALLSQGLLKGEKLTKFIERSLSMV